ncbi:membrane protein [Streptomyces tanashiensis]|nr:membrane protein [Streptomyces tanashiensis]
MRIPISEEAGMAELIVIGYDDPHVAEQAFATVQDLQRDYVVHLNGLAVVSVDADGATHVDTSSRIIGVSAASGAMWGAIFGLLFLLPGVGLLTGAALGGLVGKLSKSGVDEQFRRQVADLLKPGSAAVVIMASKLTEDKFTVAMRPHGGTVLKTSLSDEDEKELAEQLAGPQ